MFVTLSRRNTTLVNQQLGLIEALERDEEDPERLESLFKLDHLASRMRRTAESLMVLADAPTQTGRPGGHLGGGRAARGDRRCAGLPAGADPVLAHASASSAPRPPTSCT